MSKIEGFIVAYAAGCVLCAPATRGASLIVLVLFLLGVPYVLRFWRDA